MKVQVEAFARLKPTTENSHQIIYQTDPDEKVLEVIVPRDLRQGIINNVKENYAFKFSKVFDLNST